MAWYGTAHGDLPGQEHQTCAQRRWLPIEALCIKRRPLTACLLCTAMFQVGKLEVFYELHGSNIAAHHRALRHGLPRCGWMDGLLGFVASSGGGEGLGGVATNFRWQPFCGQYHSYCRPLLSRAL